MRPRRPSALRLVVNPTAGSGKGERLLGKLRSRFSYLDASSFLVTTQRGDESRLTAQAIASSCTTIAVAGGDGTCARVADEILKSGARCSVGLFPCGTGNDFAKTLGVESMTVDQIATLIEEGNSKRIDVGKIGGNHFINSCGFGFDPAVLEATTTRTFLSGSLRYVYCALEQLFAYSGLDVEVDGVRTIERALMITVTNGKWLGGAFQIAPTASAVDGALNRVIVRQSTPTQRIRIFSAVLRAKHLDHPCVELNVLKRTSLRFSSAPAIELDGELRQAKSANVEIECIPRALSVIAAPGALDS